MEISLAHYLIVSGILFSIGLLGVVVRRNAIVVLMCLELMLNAANLALVAFQRKWAAVGGGMDGQIFVFFSITVAAAEAAVMLAIIIAVYRQRQSVDVDQMDLMQELLRYEKEGLLNETQALWFRKTKPEEELYDTWEDPWEVNNLVTDPRYQGVLKRMREEVVRWTRDRREI